MRNIIRRHGVKLNKARGDIAFGVGRWTFGVGRSALGRFLVAQKANAHSVGMTGFFASHSIDCVTTIRRRARQTAAVVWGRSDIRRGTGCGVRYNQSSWKPQLTAGNGLEHHVFIGVWWIQDVHLLGESATGAMVRFCDSLAVLLLLATCRLPRRCCQMRPSQKAAKTYNRTRRALTQKVNVLNPPNTNEYAVFQWGPYLRCRRRRRRSFDYPPHHV